MSYSGLVTSVARKELSGASRQQGDGKPTKGGGGTEVMSEVCRLTPARVTLVVIPLSDDCAAVAPLYDTLAARLIVRGLTRLSPSRFPSRVREVSSGVVFHLVVFRIHHVGDVESCSLCH